MMIATFFIGVVVGALGMLIFIVSGYGTDGDDYYEVNDEEDV